MFAQARLSYVALGAMIVVLAGTFFVTAKAVLAQNCNKKCLFQKIYLFGDPDGLRPLRDYKTDNQAVRAYQDGAGNDIQVQLAGFANFYKRCQLGSWECGPDGGGGLPCNGTAVDSNHCVDNGDSSGATTCKDNQSK